jgi:hypothetical protein
MRVLSLLLLLAPAVTAFAPQPFGARVAAPRSTQQRFMFAADDGDSKAPASKPLETVNEARDVSADVQPGASASQPKSIVKNMVRTEGD